MKKIGTVIMILILSIAFAGWSDAAGVTLAWDPPSSGGVVEGYNLSYGTSSNHQANKVERIMGTQYIVSGLDEDKVYYFEVKAYNDVGESGPSNKVTWKYSDTTPPLPPDGLEVK
ncbi:MAG: fibronectin type III domain-containing protein [Deltaproteobacteria bacterium]|nr:fibronectin type III domain-containing protein [Deltaproteobacteria bacterium]